MINMFVGVCACVCTCVRAYMYAYMYNISDDYIWASGLNLVPWANAQKSALKVVRVLVERMWDRVVVNVQDRMRGTTFGMVWGVSRDQKKHNMKLI